MSFVESAGIVILLGPIGAGKTYLAVVLDVKALEAGYAVRFFISFP